MKEKVGMNDIHQDKPALVRKALVLEWCLIAYNVLEAVASVIFGYLAGSIAWVYFIVKEGREAVRCAPCC